MKTHVENENETGNNSSIVDLIGVAIRMCHTFACTSDDFD